MSLNAKSRIQALRKLLSTGGLSTQEELREQLEKQNFEVTQSTISRDLKKVGAIKGTDPEGRTIYRLAEENLIPVPMTNSLQDLILEIKSNGTLIVIRTHPGSASLVARHLDQIRPAGILGTIAGDDTIFVAPISTKQIQSTFNAIMDCL